jgi:excisionase family DNA binding protein
MRDKKVQDTLKEQIKDISPENLNAFKALPVQSSTFINLKDKDFLSIQEASILLGTSRWTIQRMIKSNRLPIAKFGDRTIIKRTSIDNLFNQ